MRLTMDQIVNAVCLNMAERHEVPVESVEVELLYDEDNGFSAEVWVQGRSRFLVEANLKEAIMRYVLNEYGQRVYPSQIELDVEDEMWADIRA
ncbi:hypothetical protein B1A99_05940 [Cohnella sp. CIP 111063]|uniref:DUF2653 family protein n=1 Tax=unclassified Cohnella TaxID=2636738 RepID=UPI000B8BCFC4|nr:MULTISPECIES: DUF2653 family protein [unclassified Cohnella]OXS61066.1 hypothetical protein B1A99_05940 [Cohnella sp. CIP 111063]PRX73611.1 uncharacterized protein DUF2653 [Cohnella sp. SGD-V74]